MAFDTITAGDFASKMCTNERNQGGTHVSTKCDCPTDGQLDTMVVKNSVGTVIGQLVGDGTGIRTTTGTFPDEVSTCMTFRSDIYMNNDLFDTYDVASYDPTTQKFTTLGCAGATGACTKLTAGKICFKTTTAGQFFPIKRKSGELTTGTTTCTGSNVANVLSGLCVAGDISRCMCGFYGAKCESGCPNGCSGAGTCSTFNKCACNKNRKGSDCSLADCPKDATGFYCSQRGKCGTDAKCTCDTGYKGTACAEKVLKDKEQADGGLGEAGKARGINGMRIGGRNDGGRWNSTIVAIFIIGMIVLFLCCCCVGVYCCFQQRARSKLRSQTKAVTSPPAKAVEMAYINPNSHVVVQAVPAQGEEVATL
jgi:hypothetical protein